MDNLIRDLAVSPEFYQEWFGTATDTQKSMLWNHIWDHAAETASDNQFIVGCYDFYRAQGRLSYRQFYFVIQAVFPKAVSVNSLKDRLNPKSTVSSSKLRETLNSFDGY